jgi:UDP-GlcNAc3NAcA epimerase
MLKIVTVIGARPQFIKASTLSRVVSQQDNIKEIIVHTGQHFDNNMSKVFFEEMQIPEPKYNLGIAGGTHGNNTGRMLEKIEEVLMTEKPDGVVVYGDTNSTLAGALAAKKIHIPVFHVEAGLRSFNMTMPEEINRILTDRISDILFCPTKVSQDNLLKEGFSNFESRIELVGDVMYDAALFYEGYAKLTESNGHLLVTVHRESNVIDSTLLTSIINGLNVLAEDHKIIFPVHPRTKRAILDLGLKTNFAMINPVGFFEMIGLIKTADLVITDSGGLQKEAFFYKKNSLVLREETEWLELATNGFTKLVGCNSQEIIRSVNERGWANTNFTSDIFGNGDAAERIVNSIKSFFN